MAFRAYRRRTRPSQHPLPVKDAINDAAVKSQRQPKLMGESVDIHPALTFIILFAGFGIDTAVGALPSIPLAAIAIGAQFL